MKKKFPKSPGLLYVIFGVYYIFKVEVVVVQLVGVPYFGAAVGILASNCAVCEYIFQLLVINVCSIANISMNFHV